jgi:hypothetical protein
MNTLNALILNIKLIKELFFKPQSPKIRLHGVNAQRFMKNKTT